MQSPGADLTEERLAKELAVNLPDTPTKTRPASRLAGWTDALKHVWAIYLATHLVMLILTYLATLFTSQRASGQHAVLQTLLFFWNRWDTNHFVGIATSGYSQPVDTAFFPLYPLLIHLVSFVIRSPLVSALIIANVAGLGVLLVFYRLVAEEFGEERAERSVLYLAIFPTAFFLAAGYSESLFLLCALGGFYAMRRGHWWLAGLAMFFAALTRSTGVALVLPFCYEYLRQRDFQWKRIGLDVLSCAGAGVAVVLYSLYCFTRFHDFLAFSHAEASGWGRHLTWPGASLLKSVQVILSTHVFDFANTRNLVELIIVLVVLVLLVLSFVGPWKFARKDWMYPLFGVFVFLLCISLPVTAPADAPLDSLDRYMLAIFPAIMVLAAMGKNRNFHQIYQALGYSLMAFYTLLFLLHRPFV
jgi:Gpi18-like mannosyltransferase